MGTAGSWHKQALYDTNPGVYSVYGNPAYSTWERDEETLWAGTLACLGCMPEPSTLPI